MFSSIVGLYFSFVGNFFDRLVQHSFEFLLKSFFSKLMLKIVNLALSQQILEFSLELVILLSHFVELKIQRVSLCFCLLKQPL